MVRNRDDEVSSISMIYNASLEELYITHDVYGPYLTLTGVPKLRFYGSLGWSNMLLDIGYTYFSTRHSS